MFFLPPNCDICPNVLILLAFILVKVYMKLPFCRCRTYNEGFN